MLNIGDSVRVVAYNAGDPPEEFLNLYDPPLTISEANEVTNSRIVGMSGVVVDITSFVNEEDSQEAAESINVPVGESMYVVYFDRDPDPLDDFGSSRLKVPLKFDRFELFTEKELIPLI